MIHPARLAIGGAAAVLLGWHVAEQGAATLLALLPALVVVVLLDQVSRRAKRRPPFWICTWVVASTLILGIWIAGSFSVWILLLLSSTVLVLAYGAHRAARHLTRTFQ